MNLKKRTMDEMITHFNYVVSEINISRKDKMTLLGMITAIGYEAQNAADVVPVVRCADCKYNGHCFTQYLHGSPSVLFPSAQNHVSG